MQEKRAEGPDIEGLARLAQETGVEPAGLETSADDLVELLLEKRQAARKEREFALSDQIRDGLAALGVRVEDVRDGYRWRFER
jgi:cysteinyl-tRNA synthetase